MTLFFFLADWFGSQSEVSDRAELQQVCPAIIM